MRVSRGARGEGKAVGTHFTATLHVVLSCVAIVVSGVSVECSVSAWTCIIFSFLF